MFVNLFYNLSFLYRFDKPYSYSIDNYNDTYRYE